MASLQAPPEDPLSVQQIISRYESAEDEFLRELESMRQGANTDTSDEFAEESPVLGTLCSLASEVRELRRQNRRLRRRLTDTSTSASSTASRRPSRASVVHRMSALFDGRQLLPKFMSSSGSSNSLKKPPSMMAEIRTGARERMSTPPKMDTLAVSAYSTDLSSDTGSSSNRPRKVPPLVLPEMSDSENDQNVCANYDNNDDNCLSPSYPRRSMLRRAHRGSISENTSPSSLSASSSVDHCDAMTSSRSSFLELIGLKRRHPQRPQAMPTGKPSAQVKKRKRKISESDIQLVQEPGKRSISTSSASALMPPTSASLLVVTAGSEGELAHAAATAINNNHGAMNNMSTGSADWSGRLPPRKQVSTSLRNVSNSPQHANSVPKLEQCDVEFGGQLRKKSRPKSVAYLSPSDLNLPRAQRLGHKAKSSRSVASKASEDTNHSTYDVADEEVQLLQDENHFLRHEIQVLKTRNAQLIDQLRDKSMLLSKNEHIFEVKLDNLKKREQMNEAAERLCLRERVGRVSEESIQAIENRLKEFEVEMQQAKNDALRTHQMAVNAACREQTAYQTCLEQVERLQRENFSLLQAQGYEVGFSEQHIRDKLEELPRYESLYAFTMRIVHRLGHMRNMLIEKSNKLNHAELELMHQQSALLVAHAQIERLKVENQSSRPQRRPVSFHGEDILAKLSKHKLNVFLPFKLHGSRVEQQRKSRNAQNGRDLSEDDGIEADFLKFFDNAKFPSKVEDANGRSKPYRNGHTDVQHNGVIENVVVYRNGRGTVSPMGSPVTAERRRFLANNASPLVQRREPAAAALSRRSSTKSSKRPCSLVDQQEGLKSGEIRKFAEEVVRGCAEDVLNATSTQSPVMRFSGRPGHVREVVSSLQDISNHVRSPSTTPILVRKVPLLGSPKFSERKLLRQQSAQSPNGSSYDNQPVYDSPPRMSGESSDYGSIESRPLQVSRRPSNRAPQSTPSTPKTQHHHHHHHMQIPTRILQPFILQNPLHSGQKKAGALLRRNSPVLNPDQRPNALQSSRWASQRVRQSASESPRAVPRFQHNHPQHLAQTIREEDERSTHSAEISEQPSSSASSALLSRLPRPGQVPAKKPQGWLSRLRLNGKKA